MLVITNPKWLSSLKTRRRGVRKKRAFSSVLGVSALHHHLDCRLRSQGYLWIKLNSLSWRQLKGDVLSQSHEEQMSLHQRKVAADADARTCTEWHVGVAREPLLV